MLLCLLCLGLLQRWRLYVFKKGEQQDDPLFIHRQSRYLLGRERRVAGGCWRVSCGVGRL